MSYKKITMAVCPGPTGPAWQDIRQVDIEGGGQMGFGQVGGVGGTLGPFVQEEERERGSSVSTW